jgi:hypothetical protein
MAQPSVVLLFAVVGLAEVLHAIPLTVTVEPPSEVMVPPLIAELDPILETALVVTPVGAVAEDVVVNETSLPYVVPTPFVAYARTWYVVLEVNPVILLVHGPPIAQPSVVLLFAVVGFADVLHAIPLTVTVEPPFEVIVPPLVAPFVDIPVTAFVVTPVGAVAAEVVVKLISLP